jgi:hypothetical protein
MPAGNRLDRETVSRPERVQTSDRCFGARESGELLKEEKQMRISEEIHASSRLNKVKELQMRIAQAIRNRMTGSLHNRKRLAKCLSRVRGNLHARFLGDGVAAMPLCYPPDFSLTSFFCKTNPFGLLTIN